MQIHAHAKGAQKAGLKFLSRLLSSLARACVRACMMGWHVYAVPVIRIRIRFGWKLESWKVRSMKVRIVVCALPLRCSAQCSPLTRIRRYTVDGGRRQMPLVPARSSRIYRISSLRLANFQPDLEDAPDTTSLILKSPSTTICGSCPVRSGLVIQETSA
jgi:hypothetical protein